MYIDTDTDTDIYLYVCVCVCMCIYIYIYIQLVRVDFGRGEPRRASRSDRWLLEDQGGGRCNIWIYKLI